MTLAGDKLNRFLIKISASTIVNQAIIKCSLNGVPVTVDNAILFVGDFFDPEDREFSDLLSEVETTLLSVIDEPQSA